jgi:lincosamide nucleotidyltransferase
MAEVRAWHATARFSSLDATLIVDRTGELARRLQDLIGPPLDRDRPENVQFVCNSFVNWLLFGSNVLARGECARALELLGIVHRYLLWMVRLAEQTTEHWPTPSKALEKDISAPAYRRYATCTANLDPRALLSAFRNTADWGRELISGLSDRADMHAARDLLDRIARRIAALRPPEQS